MIMQVFIKPTNACNLYCSHCFVPEQKKDTKIMSTQEVDTILLKLYEYFKNDKLSIVWHGGEPALAGENFYKHILDNYRQPNVKHGMQTNLTLINEKWYPIIEKLFDGRIGTSFDITRNLAGSFDKFNHLWEKRLTEVKKRFYVMAKMILTKQIMQKGAEWTVNLLEKIGVQEFVLEHFMTFGNGKQHEDEYYVPYSEYFFFVLKVRELLLNGNSAVRIRAYPSDDYFVRELEKGRTSGFFRGACAESTLVIEPDGRVSYCPIASANDMAYFGNIYTDSMDDILCNENRVDIISRQKSFYCDCEHYQNCNGGGYLIREKNVAQKEYKKVIDYLISSGLDTARTRA